MLKTKNIMNAAGNQVLISVFALLIIGLVGLHCEDDVCAVSDEPRCEGDTLVYCTQGEFSDGPVLVQEDCSPGTCAEFDSEEYAASALCVVSDEQNQACLDQSDQIGVCDGSQFVNCYGGYVTEVVDECASPEHCLVEVDGFSGCVEEVDKDPRCSATSYEVFCDGAELINCAKGYLRESVDCSSEELCYYSDQANTSGCILSDEPDGRCEAAIAAGVTPFDGVRIGCDGDLAVSCLDEYLASEIDCAENDGGCLEGTCSYPTGYIPPSDDGCRTAPVGRSHSTTLLWRLLEL